MGATIYSYEPPEKNPLKKLWKALGLYITAGELAALCLCITIVFIGAWGITTDPVAVDRPWFGNLAIWLIAVLICRGLVSLFRRERW
jgi:hypothetical protein